MKILLVHNKYQQRGGEDTVFANEYKMLKSNGVEVVNYVTSNKTINNFFSKFLYFFESIFSFRTFFYFLYFLKKEKINIVHVHNFFPKISPSIFMACKCLGVKTLLTLHNYRIICPTSKLYFNDAICERSLKESSWWTIKQRVYQKSFLGTFSLVLNIEINKYIGTWKNNVDKFICLTEFSKKKFIEFGLPEEKIIIKPNFATPLKKDKKTKAKTDYILFVGRLSDEKGIEFLVNSWIPKFPKLKIIGDGPLKEKIIKMKKSNNVEVLGQKSNEETKEIMKSANYLIMGSKWYEGFPMTIVEAFSVGTPVICPDLGSMSELVIDGKNGWKFKSQDKKSLQNIIENKCNKIENYENLIKETFNIYQKNYTEVQNFKKLISTYKSLIS